MDQDIAVRLANEGVPVRAIARAVQVPSADLRERLEEARADGYLIDLPRDDWPVGYRYQRRRLDFSYHALSKEQLLPKIQAAFQTSYQQAAVLVLLLQHREVHRDSFSNIANSYAHLGMLVFRLRKRVGLYGIRIENLRGYGFKIGSDQRRRALDLIFGAALEEVAGDRVRTPLWMYEMG